MPTARKPPQDSPLKRLADSFTGSAAGSSPANKPAQTLVKNASAKVNIPPAPPRPKFEKLFSHVFQLGDYSEYGLPSGKIITVANGEMILHIDEQSVERYLNKAPKSLLSQGIEQVFKPPRFVAMYLFAEAGNPEINQFISAFPTTPDVLRELLLVSSEQSVKQKNQVQIKNATIAANKINTQKRKTMVEVFYWLLCEGKTLGGKGFAKQYAADKGTTERSVNRARTEAEKLYAAKHNKAIQSDYTSEGLPF